MAIFANYPLQQLTSESTPLDHGLYDALSRVAWSAGVCYIIFACVQNAGGPVNTILSHPLWQPFSKLGYTIYMVHFSVVMITMATIKAPPHISELSAFIFFIGNYVLSVFVGIVAMLAFETPFVKLDKYMFSSGRRSHDNKTKSS